MPTRNINLTPQMDKFVGSRIKRGLYANASEVLREGLRLVENREVEEATKLETLRAAAQLGGSALERGEFKEFPNGLALLAHLNKIANKAASDTGDN